MTTYPPEWREGCASHYHDTEPAYSHGKCRCPVAREKSRLYRKRRREGRLPNAIMPGIGVQRRLRSLAAIGWSAPELADRTGFGDDFFYRHQRNNAPPTVLATTHDKVRDLYDHLSPVPGPSKRTRMMSQSKGWAPPLAWDDIDDPNEEPSGVAPPARPPQKKRLDGEVVEAALAWRRPAMSETEAVHVVTVAMDARGMKAPDIADMLGIPVPDVQRLRDRINSRRARARRALVAS